MITDSPGGGTHAPPGLFYLRITEADLRAVNSLYGADLGHDPTVPRRPCLSHGYA